MKSFFSSAWCWLIAIHKGTQILPDPETTIRGQCGSTESITNSHLPHTGKKLNETTVCVGGADHDTWYTDASALYIDHAENEGGEGETAETERSWIGEFPEFGFWVQTCQQI